MMLKNQPTIRAVDATHYVLVAAWTYGFWTVPEGFVTDGASIPRFAWWIVESTAGDLEVQAAAELLLDDGNRGGSTFSVPLKMTETSAEWDSLETEFGEVSLAAMLIQANQNGSTRTRVQAVVTAAVAADNDVSGPANDNNLDVNLGDLSTGTFVTDYDIYYNGRLLRNGANAAANEDVYPGTALANGQLRFEFALKAGGKPDVITVIKHAA